MNAEAVLDNSLLTMMDSEKAAGFVEEPRADPSEEAAASKLWAVYVSEAEKYDKSLVESWKSDMEGMLIFAGLFSASLTAFIIESYKNLMPDSSNTTVQLLTQISHQMTASINGTVFIPPPDAPFAPSGAAIVCNAMWFLSLGLSLVCALIATLLEQWARDFLHRSEMRSSPAIRARIFSYLYYGLKRFNMHAVVDVIPLLLHASLVLFFAGLVAFLLPINLGIAMVAAFILALVLIVYSGLTLLPLFFLDCPYRTPLSAACWKFLHSFRTRWRRQAPHSAPIASETIVEAIENEAKVADPKRDDRDTRALTWTVKSLADNAELEPFIEAIPDVLSGPVLLRDSYRDHIQALTRNPQLQLLHRIEHLLRSCESGLLAPQASRRRAITCYKGLWSIASIQSAPASLHLSPLFSNPTHAAMFPQHYPEALDCADVAMTFHDYGDDEQRQYSASALALMQWSTFSFNLSCFAALMTEFHSETANGGDGVPDMRPLLTWLEFWYQTWNMFSPDLPPLERPLQLPEDLSEMAKIVEDLAIMTAYRIVFQYLLNSPAVNSAPYRWRETRERILPAGVQQQPVPFSSLEVELEETLFALISRRLRLQTAENKFDWMDEQIWWLYTLWPYDDSTPIPLSIIRYWIAHSGLIIAHDPLRKFTDRLWLAFAITVSEGPAGPESILSYDDSPVLKALWILASLEQPSPFGFQFEPLLAAVQNVPYPHLKSASSVKVVLEMQLLRELRDEIPAAHLEHPLLKLEASATIIPSQESFGDFTPTITLYNQIVEAQISVVAKFIGDCCSGSPPFEAVITHQRVTSHIYPPCGPVHSTHQVQFAQNSHMLHTSAHGPEFFDALVNCPIFDLYAETPEDPWNPPPAPRYAWLDAETARVQLRGLLQQNIGDASLSEQSRSRVEAIILGLDSLYNGSPESSPNLRFART